MCERYVKAISFKDQFQTFEEFCGKRMTGITQHRRQCVDSQTEQQEIQEESLMERCSPESGVGENPSQQTELSSTDGDKRKEHDLIFAALNILLKNARGHGCLCKTLRSGLHPMSRENEARFESEAATRRERGGPRETDRNRRNSRR